MHFRQHCLMHFSLPCQAVDTDPCLLSQEYSAGWSWSFFRMRHKRKSVLNKEFFTMQWLYLLFTILFEVAGTTSLKLSQGFTKPLPSILVAVFYGSSFY